MLASAAALMLLLAAHGKAAPARPPEPIIDMHMHAWSLTEFGGEIPEACAGADGIDLHGIDPARPFDFKSQGSCPHMLKAPPNDEEVYRQTLRMMDRLHIVRGVIAGDRPVVAKWRASAPERFIPAANFFVDDDRPPAAYAAALEAAVKSGETSIFAEISPQYRGLSPDDPSLEPFYAMAERLDVPVGIHMGYGAPGGPYWIYPKYRAALGNPLLLEDLLVRHPRMRLYVMHAGMPMVDEIIMLMNAHPQVFVDISADNWGVPRAEFHYLLKRMVQAGYGKRIMFGSDQMVWPDSLPIAVAAIQEADFLTEAQKRDIFYNNAARFLRFTPDQIARDRARAQNPR
jgi:predicted TIM-barrel fold metal-dependent hydrolase